MQHLYKFKLYSKFNYRWLENNVQIVNLKKISRNAKQNGTKSWKLKKLQHYPITSHNFASTPFSAFHRDYSHFDSLVCLSEPTYFFPFHGTFSYNQMRWSTRPFTFPFPIIRGRKQPFKVNQQFNWSSSNVVYSVICSAVEKLSTDWMITFWRTCIWSRVF